MKLTKSRGFGGNLTKIQPYYWDRSQNFGQRFVYSPKNNRLFPFFGLFSALKRRDYPFSSHLLQKWKSNNWERFQFHLT
jgi:hypothetical protein